MPVHPPRMRGTHPTTGDVAQVTRFIPAHAGNTTTDTGVTPAAAVHPRACGEHYDGIHADIRSTGSSPRMRGTLFMAGPDLVGQRFVPAHAGNTEGYSRTKRPESVHPRACGEHPVRASSSWVWSGSSPRMRGTRQRPEQLLGRDRFIPAHAGNTSPRTTGSTRTSGSSPRMRGTRGSPEPAGLPPRFIPAHAGNTERGQLLALGHDGSSPRMRGTLALKRYLRLERRFIPAHAGNTSPSNTATKPISVHPRACGEHYSLYSSSANPVGSSPRMRGTRLAALGGIH